MEYFLKIIQLQISSLSLKIIMIWSDNLLQVTGLRSSKQIGEQSTQMSIFKKIQSRW